MSEQNSPQKNPQEFLAEVIELYKSQPCLWKIKSKEYSNRKKKSKAYEMIINKYKEVGEEVDRDTIVKKINSLRSCYRKEKRKVLEALVDNQYYRPRLWYFNLLKFLDYNDNEMLCDESPQPPDNTRLDFYEELSNTERPQSIRSSYTINTASSMQKSKKRLNSDPFDYISRESENTATQFDYAAKGWAIALNQLPKEQKLFASRIINEVLFQAQMGNLSSNTRLTDLEPNLENNQCIKVTEQASELNQASEDNICLKNE